VARTLLLADDSVTIQRVIELTFADEDIQVVAVSDGDEAIAILDKTPPDIVLADVGMPGRNGYEVARHVKDTPRLAHIPVVLLTGAFEPVDQAKAAAAGCDGVLAKPFEPQLVIGRVKELLARPRQVAPSLDAPLSPPPTPAPRWTAPLVEPPAAHAAAKPAPEEVNQ
jgi:CheY-like chemotaxis protein